MFRTASGAAPVRYYYTKDTTVVDPAGRVVTWSAIRPDMPATVYYSTVGDRVVVRKVVLTPSQPAVIKQRGNDYDHYDEAVAAELFSK